LIVGAIALARVALGVHFLSDVLAGITLGIGWVAVTAWAYVAWRRETGQPVERPAEVGKPSSPLRGAELTVHRPDRAQGVN
jgi:membrane-associated phospholipid phosphatase